MRLVASSDTPGGRADVLSIETPESVAFTYELAGAGSRGAAAIVDMSIIALLVSVEAGTSLVVASALSAAGADEASPWVAGGFILASFITYWGYYTFGEVLRGGRTPGKRLLGIRVVRDDGSRVTFIDSAIRNVLRIVDMLPGYYAVGLVAMLVSRHAKRLGDMAAGTVVVRDVVDLPLVYDAVPERPADALVREFLARRASLTEAARLQVASELLASYGVSVEGSDEPAMTRRLAELAGVRAAVDGRGVPG